jgi:hypothetical protein
MVAVRFRCSGHDGGEVRPAAGRGMVRRLQGAADMSVAIRQQPATTAQAAPPDNWLDALTKLVPGEVIAAFTAALQIDGVAGSRTAQLITLIIMTPFAALVPYLSVRGTGTRAHPLQYVVRVAAFVLYALASSPAFMAWLDGLHWIPGVLTLVVALLASFVISPPGRTPRIVQNAP